MKALDNVWLYVDAIAPGGDALAAAVEACRRSGAVLTVVGAIGRGEDRIFETSFGEQVLQVVRKDRESRLLGLAASARGSLPAGRVRAVLLEGEVPWHSVAAHAAAHPPDLVVVAAGGAPPGGLDSATQHLFRKCAAPVWAVRPGGAAFPRSALVAVDPAVAGSDERRLALRVLELARRLADGGPLELHVANAWSVPAEELLCASIGEASARAYADALRDNARRYMTELLADAAADGVAEVHLPKGDPASAIPALASRLEADLVVLGSAGRTRLAGFFIGSTAEAIIGHLARSVLVVKPPGFVSPVRPSGRERATPLDVPP